MFFHQDLVRSVLTAACIRVGRLSMRPEKYQPWGFHVLFFKNHKLIHCILKIALAQVQVMLTFFFLGKNTKHLLRYSLASKFPFAQDLSSSPSLWNFYLVGGRAWQYYTRLSKSSFWENNVGHKSSGAMDFEIKTERHCNYITLQMYIESLHCIL